MGGTAKTMRAHHPEMGVEDSLHWAALLRDPYTRCGICGLPERIRAAYRRAGWRTHPFVWRLSLDRVDPWKGYGDRSNLRVLCMRCNKARGKAVYTDEEVLRKVRGWYTAVLTAEELWWLNTSPGQGGAPTKGRQYVGDNAGTIGPDRRVPRGNEGETEPTP